MAVVGFIFSSTVFGANKLVMGGNHGVRRNAMFLSSAKGLVNGLGLSLILYLIAYAIYRIIKEVLA